MNKLYKDGKYTEHLDLAWGFVDLELFEYDEKIAAVERNMIMEGPVELTSLYTLEMSQLQNGSWAMCCIGGEVMPLFPQETKKLWFSSKLMKIKFDLGDILKILATDMKKKNKKDCRTGVIYADSSIMEMALRLDET